MADMHEQLQHGMLFDRPLVDPEGIDSLALEPAQDTGLPYAILDENEVLRDLHIPGQELKGVVWGPTAGMFYIFQESTAGQRPVSARQRTRVPPIEHGRRVSVLDGSQVTMLRLGASAIPGVIEPGHTATFDSTWVPDGAFPKPNMPGFRIRVNKLGKISVEGATGARDVTIEATYRYRPRQ